MRIEGQSVNMRFPAPEHAASGGVDQSRKWSGDEWLVGSEAAEINELVSILRNREQERVERVQQATEAYRSGTLHVSGKDVLFKIVGDRYGKKDSTLL